MVSQGYFRSQFGIMDAAGENPNTQKANDINSNVVSVLQAGAFFGALGSAPLSGGHRAPTPPFYAGIWGYLRPEGTSRSAG